MYDSNDTRPLVPTIRHRLLIITRGPSSRSLIICRLDPHLPTIRPSSSPRFVPKTLVTNFLGSFGCRRFPISNEFRNVTETTRRPPSERYHAVNSTYETIFRIARCSRREQIAEGPTSECYKRRWICRKTNFPTFASTNTNFPIDE